MEDNKYLKEEKISKLMLKFSIPCILSLLISSLYNIVDQIFIGHSSLGYLGNAATGVVFPITVIALAFAWAIGDGSAAYLSLSQGRKDMKNVPKAIGTGIVINFIISIIFVIISVLFMDNILYLFGASNKTLSLSKDYFIILLYFMPGYMIANGVNSIIRADGSPRYSMMTTLVGAIANIILDPIFIFTLDMGIKGAAIATVIGQFITLVLSLVYFKNCKTFKLTMDSFKIDLKIFSSVIKLGISTFITQLAIVIISLTCNLMLAKYGVLSKYGQDIPIAVIGICMKVFTIVINIVVGITIGSSPIFGYNYGAKRYDRVKDTFKYAIICTTIVGLIGTLIFQLCPSVIINIFGSSNDLYMEFAIKTFRIFLLFLVFTCIIKLSSIFFQAVGTPIKAIIISLSRDILFFIPLVIILPIKYGIDGVLYAAPIADLLGIIITIIILRGFFKKLNKNINEEDNNVNILESTDGVIITISRTHGSKGKYIGSLLANKLGIPFYYKELTALAAKDSGLDKEFISKINTEENVLHSLYLTTQPVKYAIEAQEKIIKEIASKGSCVIVGRAADYVLRDNKNLVRIFIYADNDYAVNSIMDIYKDTKEEAISNIKKSNKNRASYYKIISGNKFGDYNNYDLCINSSIGPDKTVDIIYNYIKNK